MLKVSRLNVDKWLKKNIKRHKKLTKMLIKCGNVRK